MTKSKDIKIQINVKNSLLLFGIISIVMFIYMFFEKALIDDGAFHMGRLMALSEDISWSNLKPWIYSKTNFGTGYPLGIFYPDLFLYPFALLAKTPVGPYVSYVFMMMCINFASVVVFYLCSRKILIYRENENFESMAFVMALMYLAYPYRLWCLYVRMALGESMFFVFFPIIILGVYELFYNKKFSLMLFVGMIGMVYSHILSTAICIIVLVVFYIINIKKLIEYPKIILYTVINAIFTVLCGLSVVLPILEMQNFTTLYYMTGTKTFGELVEHTIRIVNNDKVSVVCTVVAIFVCGVIAYKGGIKSKLACVSIFIIFMCTDMFCWAVLEDVMPFLNTLQFPYRLLGIAGVSLSILCAMGLYKHKPLYISYPIIMITFMLLMVSGKYLPIEGIDMYGVYSVGKGEYVTEELRNYIVDNLDVPNVKEEYKIEITVDTYSFETKDGAVVLPLAYYKGYEISDENRTYDYGMEVGLIKVENVEGSKLKVVYKGTFIQKMSLGISVISFLSIALGCISRKKGDGLDETEN